MMFNIKHWMTARKTPLFIKWIFTCFFIDSSISPPRMTDFLEKTLVENRERKRGGGGILLVRVENKERKRGGRDILLVRVDRVFSTL